MKNTMYLDALQTLSDGICIIDKDYRIVFWNKRLELWSHQAADTMVGQVLLDIYPRLNSVEYKVRIDQVLKHGPPAFFSMLLHHHMLEFIGANGEAQAQRVTVSPLHDADGGALALITVVDMTRSALRESKYKQMLSAYEHELQQRKHLEQQNKMLVRAVDRAAEAFVIMRVSGEIEYANKAFLEQTGSSSQIFQQGLSYWDDYLLGMADDVDNVARFIVLSGDTWQGRSEIKKKDGSFFVASVSIAPIVNSKGKVTHAVVVQEDISDQLHFEEQYRKSQKQEALATLIGGIAHDFNNLLSGILGHLYLANREVKDMPKTAVRMEKIQGTVNEIASIVQQLMTFARKGEVSRRKFPLDSFIKEFIRLAEHTVPDNIQLRVDFQRDSFPCHGNVEGLQEALLNMIQNAVDAAVDERDSQITLGLQTFDAEAQGLWVAKHPVLGEGSYAHITITDNGFGIDAAHIDRVFDPFFTTKNLGSGLGLAVAIGNVKNNHGLIDVESSEEGTILHVWLPLHLETTTTYTAPCIQPRQETKTILLVDDDALVRSTTAEILTMLGYEILMAEDGQVAVDMMNLQGGEVDLVIMDMVMPRMVGSVAAKCIREQYPEVPIIFATAYDQSISIKATKELEHSVLISKPFHPDLLQENIEGFLQ